MAWNFLAELARHGPGGTDKPMSLPESRNYCARFTRAHSENFTVASVLLPRRLLPHFHAIYAYCRWADDLADETGGGSHALALLDWWRRETLAAFAGNASHPITVAVADTAKRYGIPPDPFLTLLVAFEQDQRVNRYATFAELLRYCEHSANPVGHLLLYLFECFTPERAALADEVCTGLQLANFWQDVARDFAKDRIYLPVEDRIRFGYPDSDLFAPKSTPEFAELMRFQVLRTQGYFDRGRGLLPLVPREVRIDVDLFIRGGEATLRAIERGGYDVWTRRPVVSKWKKAELLMRALVGW